VFVHCAETVLSAESDATRRMLGEKCILNYVRVRMSTIVVINRQLKDCLIDDVVVERTLKRLLLADLAYGKAQIQETRE